MSAMIDVRAVTKRFGSFAAVDDVSLEIRAGEFLTLLGPSGCGKTTLLRLISGFEQPDAGSIRIAGEDVTWLPPYRRNVNQVFQSYALFPHLSVRENIAFGLRMQKVPAAESARRVEEVMGLVALAGFEDRKPSELSGGQRQRVALARAIVPRPAVLLLDEPLSALDAKLRRAMQLELKQLQRRLGMTFVFVTHDQEEALTMSDRIAVFGHGRIEQLGTAAEIYHQPCTAFVADFVGEANVLRAAVNVRRGDWLDVMLPGNVVITVSARAVPVDATTVTISVRPEKVCLVSSVAATENVFAARVEEVVFQGATSRLILTAGSGLQLVALVANESALRTVIQAGDQVMCGLHPDDLVVVGSE
ncbi:spermidine/putrescine ABC transporter ATP-binding protein PotA [Opitutaceae bacterium]